MASSSDYYLAVLSPRAWAGQSLLRQAMLFTLGAILVYRIGTYIPVPGVNAGFMARLLDEHRNDALGLLDVFTGGAVRRFSIFTLNIVPYATAIGLLKSATPFSARLRALKEQGWSGQRTLNHDAMMLAVLVALVSSYQTAVALESAHNAAGPAVLHPGWLFRITCMLTLTAGSSFLTWLCHQINERGIGLGFTSPGAGLGFVLIGASGLFVSLPQAIGTLSGFGGGAGAAARRRLAAAARFAGAARVHRVLRAGAAPNPAQQSAPAGAGPQLPARASRPAVPGRSGTDGSRVDGHVRAADAHRADRSSGPVAGGSAIPRGPVRARGRRSIWPPMPPPSSLSR